jgi:hypothetical protein
MKAKPSKQRMKKQPPQDALQKVAALRQAVALTENKDDSFSPLLNAFFDLTESADFRAACDQVSDPKISAILQAVMPKMIPGCDEQTPLHPLVMRLRGSTMLHGATAMTHGHVGMFFYFEDLEQGMVSVTQPKGAMKIARLTRTVAPEGTLPGKRPLGPPS